VTVGHSSDVFQATDMNGNPFWVEWDGAERIGFWVGNPNEEYVQALDIETSRALVKWFQDEWEVTE
jgi:hypothetical protein